MPPLPIALASKSNQSRHGIEGAARLINCYAEQLGDDGRSSFAVYSVSGSVPFSTPGTGGIRALVPVDHDLYAISGRSICRIDTSGRSRVVGGLPSDGLVTAARNRRDTPEVGFVSDGIYYIATRTSFRRVDLETLPPPNSICEIDGYFVFTIDDGRAFVSGLNEGSSVEPLGMFKAEASADGLLRGFVRNRDLMLMGSRSIEFWTNTGGDPNPFSRTTSIDIGCWSAGSVASVLVSSGGALVDGVAWIATDAQGAYAGVVMLTGGYQPVKISTYQADRDISSDPNPLSIRSFSWTELGHSFYAVVGTGYTWVFDASTNLPHERRSYGHDNWRVSCAAVFAGKTLFGDTDTGSIYSVDQDAKTEAGRPIICVNQCPVSHASPSQIRWNSLTPEAIATPLSLGTPGPVSPKVMIDYSHDGGRTWSAQVIGDGVIVGNRVERIRPVRRLGVSPPSGRTWRFSWQASDIRGLIACNADAERLPA